jgi:hypothetical protein
MNPVIEHGMLELWCDGQRYSRHWITTASTVEDVIRRQERLSAAYHKRERRNLSKFRWKQEEDEDLLVVEVFWKK